MSTNTTAVTEAVLANPETAVVLASESARHVGETSDANPAQPESGETIPQKLRRLGVLSPAEVDRICDEETRAPFLVDGFLPAKSIGIAAGDSTIGKSPLMYQLGLCVAAGIPFLGQPSKQGCVIYFDLENGMLDSRGIRDALVRFLGLSVAPDNFLLATEPKDLQGLIAEVKPDLVIIDSLRAFAPETTERNRPAAEWLKDLRKLTRKHGASFLIVHHIRKPQQGGFVHGLESTSVATWMLEMEGPRAFVNQTDVRISLEQGDSEPAALRMKWSRRVHGDSPLVQLERVFREDGEPAGYSHLTGADLLNPDRREALLKLPNEFRFKDAKAALNRSDDPTNKFLNECKQLGIIEKRAGGGYRKISAATVDAAPESAPVAIEWIKRCSKLFGFVRIQL